MVVHRAIWWSLVGWWAIHSRLGLIGEVKVKMKVKSQIETGGLGWFCSSGVYGEIDLSWVAVVKELAPRRAAVLQKERSLEHARKREGAMGPSATTPVGNSAAPHAARARLEGRYDMCDRSLYTTLEPFARPKAIMMRIPENPWQYFLDSAW